MCAPIFSRNWPAAKKLGHDCLIIAPGPETREEEREGGRIQWVKAPPIPVDKRYHLFWKAEKIHHILGEGTARRGRRLFALARRLDCRQLARQCGEKLFLSPGPGGRLSPYISRPVHEPPTAWIGCFSGSGLTFANSGAILTPPLSPATGWPNDCANTGSTNAHAIPLGIGRQRLFPGQEIRRAAPGAFAEMRHQRSGRQAFCLGQPPSSGKTHRLHDQGRRPESTGFGQRGFT